MARHSGDKSDDAPHHRLQGCRPSASASASRLVPVRWCTSTASHRRHRTQNILDHTQDPLDTQMRTERPASAWQDARTPPPNHRTPHHGPRANGSAASNRAPTLDSTVSGHWSGNVWRVSLAGSAFQSPDENRPRGSRGRASCGWLLATASSVGLVIGRRAIPRMGQWRTRTVHGDLQSRDARDVDAYGRRGTRERVHHTSHTH
ncbi:hypothetical protein C8Q74DRAFT_411130 [Fomes fomentarius]|nr:hypothetical protein C8Q74DRAFT_411130 [Fomes fomentarius]